MDQIKTGKFIATLRHGEGMTQEALAQKIGVTNKTISRWETGNYMPDIEMLQLLSEIFHVSINELLCGERLTDSEFKEKADLNLISVFKESSFSLKERTAFWKQKWIKDHISFILACATAGIGLFAWAWYEDFTWIAGACPFLGIIAYMIFRNRMMIYIEDRIYPQRNNGQKA
ncbi:transcriptional regulator with XRE-family HTH domain [Anaerotaenia torta]|uniref:helix-turn-helix domain-containing protein n=1 Tax=Anaerotaenia torta TaxID=433293 RepID=UPI003D20841E